MHRLHVKAKGNWMNDPNGLIYFKGKYHLFYQCFPYAPRWGRMHWGHMVSDNLIDWEERGIALYPSKRDDRDGCFSGSAIEKEGRLYLYYTGVRYLQEDPNDINLCLEDQFVSSQMMMTSEDGCHFDNIADKKTLIPVLEEGALVRGQKIGDDRHTRDPKVWREEDGYYMVLGSTIDDAFGQLLFFRSEDGECWTYVNSISKEDKFGWMWECPDFFSLDDASVLIFSPMNFYQGGDSYADQTIAMCVDFETEGCRMHLPDQYQYLDYGMDLYAPQTCLDEDGNRMLFAWLRMPEAVDGQWRGMQSLPRQLEVKDKHIYFHVHPKIKEAFCREIKSPREAVAGLYRISFSLEEGQELNIGGYIIRRRGCQIETDRRLLVKEEWCIQKQCQTPELRDAFCLDVYVDDHVIEVFVNDGEYVISNCVYGLGQKISSIGDVPVNIRTLKEEK